MATNTIKLVNTNPLGAIDLPILGRTIEAGEEFEVTADLGKALLKQIGNYAEAKTTKPAKATDTPEGKE
jgi:hypothetical protein